MARYQIKFRLHGSDEWLHWIDETDASQCGFELTALLLGALKDSEGNPIRAAEVTVTDTHETKTPEESLQ